MIDGDDCGAVSGMNEWQAKSKYSEETFPSAALTTTDPTHNLALPRIRVVEVGSRRLTARAMARFLEQLHKFIKQ
jgi:hypothetical protein